MNFEIPVDKLVSGLFTVIGALLVFIMRDIANTMKHLREGITSLNEKMGVIVSRVDSHEGRIQSLEKKD